MTILSKFTVTPLLYVIAALLLVVAGLGVKIKLQAADVSAARSQVGTVTAQRDAVITEREAWKTTANAGADANQAATDAIDSLRTTLQQQQQQCTAMRAANDKAIAAARADAADADRTLKLFTAKFQTESRKPDCGRALQAMQAACPLLEDY